LDFRGLAELSSSCASSKIIEKSINQKNMCQVTDKKISFFVKVMEEKKKSALSCRTVLNSVRHILLISTE
jgi:hypothetical protein